MVYGFMRGNDLNLLLHFTFNIVVILKLPLEPSLRNKMHTAVTGKYFFSFSEVKSQVLGNSCFVIGQIPFHYFFILHMLGCRML